MKNALLLFVLIFLLACQGNKEPFTGKYELEVKGMKNVSTGELEIVGEPDDYFGRITFKSKRDRVYEIGLLYDGNDSLYFTLPGNGGFLSLKKNDSMWTGNFKYFGIQAEVKAKKIGSPSMELEKLVSLKPIGRGIISTAQEETFPSYDPTNQILYFCRDQKIFSSQLKGNSWEEPAQLPFSAAFNDSAPYVFNKGQALLFTSNRPIQNDGSKKKNLWQVNRTDGAWDTPQPLPSPINIDTLGDYHGAISGNGNLYFISYGREGGFGRSDIFFGTKNKEADFQVANLGARINSEKSEADVYIDPNEKFLLFASTGREDSFGADDIYISFRDGESWSTPQNLGPEVNSFAYEYGAWVDQSNGYLYFNSFRRGTSDIYRIKLDKLEVFKLAQSN